MLVNSILIEFILYEAPSVLKSQYVLELEPFFYFFIIFALLKCRVASLEDYHKVLCLACIIVSVQINLVFVNAHHLLCIILGRIKSVLAFASVKSRLTIRPFKVIEVIFLALTRFDRFKCYLTFSFITYIPRLHDHFQCAYFRIDINAFGSSIKIYNTCG